MKALRTLRTLALILVLLLPASIKAQVTTASISGHVMDTYFSLAGAEVLAIHVPTNTRYGTVTNASGNYYLNNLKAGGPYKLYVTYKDHYPEKFEQIYLRVGRDLMFDVFLDEKELKINELTVTADAYNNMRIDQNGINRQFTSRVIETTPTISHSMNDVIVLTPQSGLYDLNLSIGGGNYRQSYITIDGAGFNDVFGLNGNLPANGAPIALDAIDQISVQLVPFDVRQSGFTGSQVNAITKSGTNEHRGSVYAYLTNENLKGNKVGSATVQRNHEVKNIVGFTIGGPIVKDKLFYFANFEYERKTISGPQALARDNENEPYGEHNIHRTTKADLDEISECLAQKHGYSTGKYQGYNFRWPDYRLLARLDWNINERHSLNFRYTLSRTRSNTQEPASSVSPFEKNVLYPGGSDNFGDIPAGQRSSSKYSMYYENSCFYTKKIYSTISTELKSQNDSKTINNLLRYTNSYQNEPRVSIGALFPCVDILKDGASYISLGTDKYTYQNASKVWIHNITDEFSLSVKKHKLIFGLSAEYANIENDFHQFGNGFYVYNSMEDFQNRVDTPAAFGFAFANDGSSKLPSSGFDYFQMSVFAQDQFNVNSNFKVTAGLRLDKYLYYGMSVASNKEYEKLNFGGEHYRTDYTPSMALNFSPRIGFNWDITGDRKIILRGGTGIFFSRIPNVWLASQPNNSNVSQTIYTKWGDDVPNGITFPRFETNQSVYNEILGILKKADPSAFDVEPKASENTCVIDKNLVAPYSWKSSLAVDFKLPHNFEISIEGIYKKDYKPLVADNKTIYYDGKKTIQLSKNDVRKVYDAYQKENCFYLTNAGSGSYYTSINLNVKKEFNKNFDASVNFTYSNAKIINDGSSTQLSALYNFGAPSVNGVNEHELGYANYISPYRILANVGYKFYYGKRETWGTHINLIYDGSQLGFFNDGSGFYMASRYSYLLNANFVNDRASSNLMYIPATKDELTFMDNNGVSAEQQREAFWNFVEQDSYLSKHKGEYAKRNGAVMPWHHQFDIHINEEYNFSIKKRPQCFEFGLDIINVTNLICSKWGNYMVVNTTNPLSYHKDSNAYTFNTENKKTFSKYEDLKSTYQIIFNLKYKF